MLVPMTGSDVVGVPFPRTNAPQALRPIRTMKKMAKCGILKSPAFSCPKFRIFLLPRGKEAGGLGKGLLMDNLIKY
jgi:hypothetical protein